MVRLTPRSTRTEPLFHCAKRCRCRCGGGARHPAGGGCLSRRHGDVCRGQRQQPVIIGDDYFLLVSLLKRPKFTNSCRSEEHTSELQSLMCISYAVFCLKHKTSPTTPYSDHYYLIITTFYIAL